MSRSMVPFASLISTGLRLMSELHRDIAARLRTRAGPGPTWQTRRTLRPAGRPRTPSRTRTQARNAGARPGPPVRPSHWQRVVSHCVPGTSLSEARVPARPARGPGRAAGRLQPRHQPQFPRLLLVDARRCQQSHPLTQKRRKRRGPHRHPLQSREQRGPPSNLEVRSWLHHRSAISNQKCAGNGSSCWHGQHVEKTKNIVNR